ncbi:MAG: Peptidyl-prolyl cis-trans isomerase [Gemmataceae bacterium]|nr:Peptidyl-prolyl cis-trans isomerase [Gemmataceae bacterium]
MESLRFRPLLDCLEDKCLLSVSASQVFAAFSDAAFTTTAMREVASNLGEPRTTGEVRALATYLRQLGDISRADAPVLAEFHSALMVQISANPSLATTMGPYVNSMDLARLEAIVNGAYSDVFSVGFGATPRKPPPPTPVPTHPGNPPGSTLPFSLADPAWQTLFNGVRFWDVSQGTGAPVKAGDHITVNYTGYLTNGTVFDSSFSRNQPLSATLDLTSLIAGWVTGIPGMKPGGVRRLDIPPQFAYGSKGQGSTIPPNAELVFDITLISSP